MSTRLLDVAKKWTRECSIAEELRELVVTEQLLNTLPRKIQICIRERKPKTSSEAGRLGDDYLQAHWPKGSLATVTPGWVEKVPVAAIIVGKRAISNVTVPDWCRLYQGQLVDLLRQRLSAITVPPGHKLSFFVCRGGGTRG